jgi:uncharacterized membrane protein
MNNPVKMQLAKYDITGKCAAVRQNKFKLFMIFLSASLFVLFMISGFSRHLNYMTSINDLGHFDQAVWGFLKGFPFLNTDSFNTQTSRLGMHFDPILAFFAPLYLIHPSVGWLIIAQSLALSMACWPVFFLARKIFMSEKTAFMWAVIFSFNPFVLNAAAWDFHPVTLAVPFIIGAYLAVEMKKFNWLLICCVIILLCKEHFGLLVIGLGMLWAIRHREWIPGLFLIVLGALHVWLVFYMIMPHFSPTGRHLMFSEGQGQLSRYTWLGNSALSIITESFKHPFSTLWTVLYHFKGALYIVLIMLPFLGLPLIGIEFLLPGMADLGANLLSANPLPRSIFSYHSATLIAVCTVAAMYGSKRIKTSVKKFSSMKLSVCLLTTTILLGWIFFPFFSLPGSFDPWEKKKFLKFHDPDLAEVKSIIKPDLSISAQANVGPHFSQRMENYLYPNKIGYVDAIVLRLENPTTSTELSSLRHHLQLPPSEYLNEIRDLLNNTEYKIVFWRDPWLIFTKNDDANQSSSMDTSQIQKKIDDLKSLWQLDEISEMNSAN